MRAGGIHARGRALVWQGACVAGRDACMQQRQPLKRALCIILECILVANEINIYRIALPEQCNTFLLDLL